MKCGSKHPRKATRRDRHIAHLLKAKTSRSREANERSDRRGACRLCDHLGLRLRHNGEYYVLRDFEIGQLFLCWQPKTSSDQERNIALINRRHYHSQRYE
jgi:hypothetical protein